MDRMYRLPLAELRQTRCGEAAVITVILALADRGDRDPIQTGLPLASGNDRA